MNPLEQVNKYLAFLGAPPAVGSFHQRRGDHGDCRAPRNHPAGPLHKRVCFFGYQFADRSRAARHQSGAWRSVSVCCCRS